MSLQLVNTIAIVFIAVLAVMSIGVSYWHARSKQVARRDWFFDWVSGFSTEMAGALLTAVLFGLIVGAAQEGQNEQDLKQGLIRQLRSEVNEVTIRAAEELQQRGWLRDGSLQGAVLSSANLQGAVLSGANLQRARLESAKLQGAVLSSANLQGAYLGNAKLQGVYLGNANLQEAVLLFAKLQGAVLLFANLQEAYLSSADLQGAVLLGANLQGADLSGANLQGAVLDSLILNENTILPDGSNWTPNRDLLEFTDPNHSNFWRSDVPFSPAYSENIPTPTP